MVLKTSTRQTIFLPVVGLVDATQLKPGDLVGVNKDSYLILDTLPAEYDSRVKAMEVRRRGATCTATRTALLCMLQCLVSYCACPGAAHIETPAVAASVAECL